MSLDAVVTRADQLIVMGQQVLATRRSSGYGSDGVDSAPMKGFRTAVLSFIDRIYGRDHPHFAEFESTTNDSWIYNAENGLAIVQTIRDEIAGGWLFTVRGLVAAEVFADFLEMAEHLLDVRLQRSCCGNGWKCPRRTLAATMQQERDTDR